MTVGTRKNYYSVFFCLFFSPFIYGMNNDIVIEEISSGSLDAEKKLFVEGFSKSYKALNKTIQSSAQKLPENITGGGFKDEIEAFNARKSGGYFLRAKSEERVVGYASFEKTDVDSEVYIRQLIVDQDFERMGIGKQLCFDSIFKLLPDTKHIVVIARRANSKGVNFYEKLGFKECDYMHEGYSPELYIGLEYFAAANK